MGLEYNPAVQEVVPTANWIVAPETDGAPLVTFGTSSDRIFTPEGYRSYYLTFAKGIPGWPLSPYVSVNYSEFERGLNFPFGCNISLSRTLDFMPMNDGRRTHLLLSLRGERQIVSLMLVDMNRVGISVSFGW